MYHLKLSDDENGRSMVKKGQMILQYTCSATAVAEVASEIPAAFAPGTTGLGLHQG